MFAAMTIDSGVYDALNILLKVVLWSLIISSPAIILTIEMYMYERYKKFKNTEEQEKERILLGKANKIVKQDEIIEWKQQEVKKLEAAIEVLKVKEKYLQDKTEDVEPEVDDAIDPKEKKDLNNMNIKQLKNLAKEKKVPLYSKLNKKQLIEKLSALI